MLPFLASIVPSSALYAAAPIFLPEPSSLSFIAAPAAILPDDVAVSAADAKSTDERFRLEAGRTAIE